jgi:hypothetical protein
MDNFSLQNWRLRVVNEESFREGQGELNVYGYATKHFDICPGARALFKDILAGEFTDGIPSSNEQDKIVELAKLHDALFAIEKMVLAGANKLNNKEKKDVFSRTLDVASDIYELGREIGLDANHRGEDLGYIQNHVELINDLTRDDKDELDEIELEIPGEENAPAGDKALDKKLTKNDKIINAYKEIEQEIKDSIQKMKSGNEGERKAALNFLKANQDTIKAYNNLKKV